MLSGWQIQAMWEADAAAEWERINEPDQYETVLKKAAQEVKKAISAIDNCADHLADASAELSETPMQAKVDSFIESLENIWCDLRMLNEHWERGERE